jgi:aspartyl-tRNA(Asn)/glutamyl-tRNA(Gln) amidotransferase subunit B
MQEATADRISALDGRCAALVSSRSMAEYFEHTLAAGVDPTIAANWCLGDVSAKLNQAEMDIAESPVASAALAEC